MDLQKHVTLIAGDFDVRKLENLGEPIDSLLQEAKFRKFDKDLHSRVNNFNSKVDEISVKVFKPIKESIRDVIESVEKVKFTTYSFFEVFDACEAIRKEPLFIEGLLACSKYTEFRDKLEKVVDVSHTPKRELANQLLSMESQVNFYRDSQVLLQRHLSDLIPLEKDMVDSVKRVRALYALKVIRMIVESAHKLKYRAKDKLIKFNEKYSNLAQQTEFLQVPMKLEEACLAARAEVNDSHERSQNANNVYGLLSKAIMENQTKREEFLQKYGHVLPRTTFPELIQPRIKAQNLASLLSFSDNQEAIEQYTKVELSTDEINTYYQAELLTLEKNYVARLKNAKAREEKLEKDMIALSHSLVKSAREKDCLVKMIKDFSVELNLCRNKGGERYAKNFQEELRKLREKEAAFKRMHMENLRALREENNRLKQELNGRIN